MSDSLRNKTVKGIAWSALDKILVKSIQFIINIIIARILMPEDYGIIGMIMVFITLSSLLIDSGFSQALVQKKDRTQIDMATAFYFNIIIAIVCYTLLYVAAPIIALFYDMSILCPVLRVIGLVVIFNSLCTVQRANLLIKLDFKTSAMINVMAALASGIVGVIFAKRGHGVWSLVYQTLTMQSIIAILLWLIGGWRPAKVFSLSSIKGLWHFGSKLLMAGTVATVVREINSIVIGRFYRAQELGYYHRAVQTTDVVSMTTNDIINAVTFPVLSSVQDDRERLKSIYSQMLSMTAFCIFPIMALLALLAEPLVILLLTEKWEPVVPLIQWLCIARVFTPISALNMNILNAIGRSDLYLKVDLSKLPITLGIMAITLPIGVEAVVAGATVSSFICYFINAYYPGKFFKIGARCQVKMFYKTILSTIVLVSVGLLLMQVVDYPFIQVLIVGVLSIVSYVGSAIALKSQDVRLLINVLKSYLIKFYHA